MAISQLEFPPRKRRPSAGSFLSPSNLSDPALVESLLALSHEISVSKPLEPLQKRNSSSIIHKSKILEILFEEILRGSICVLPDTAVLCFKEIFVILQRIKTLLEDCSNGSKMWLLMENESVSNSFHELTHDLSTVLDIFPLEKLDLSQEVREQVALTRNQCRKSKVFVNPKDEKLRSEILELLVDVEREIVPDRSKLEAIFNKLRLNDSRSCTNEIKRLEDEIQNRISEKSKARMIALIGLVRYAKCVLYGASTPRSDVYLRSPATDLVIPADFRCPISLDLMRDPVVVATGQTYDRTSIRLWIDSGHATCPKTGQTLIHSKLIPNHALKNLIAQWSREQNIPFERTETNSGVNGVTVNKAALEATKMTALFLVEKLAGSPSTEEAYRIVHELRLLAKTDSSNRACIAEAGAMPLLLPYLGSDDPSLQVSAVTLLLNLSILEANKKRIMETNGALNGVIKVLTSGATWEAKENAAATLFSLSTNRAYSKNIGKDPRVLKGLVVLARNGPLSSKRDALVAILNLAGEKETVGRLVEGGVVEMAVGLGDEVAEEAVALLAVVAKRGGAAAVAAAARGAVAMIVRVLMTGTERARENAAAALVSICRRGKRGEAVLELMATPGIERVIWELMGTGSERTRRKAMSLARIWRRWAIAAAAEEHPRVEFGNYVSRTVLRA